MKLDLTGVFIRATLNGKIDSYDILEVYVRDSNEFRKFIATKEKKWVENLTILLLGNIAGLHSRIEELNQTLDGALKSD